MIFVGEQIFESKIDRRDIDKLESYKEKLPDNLVEFRMWIDNYYKKMDEKLMSIHEI